MREDGTTRYPTANSDSIGENDIRFVDGISFSLGECISIENSTTGKAITLSRDALPILDQLLNWTNPTALVRQALKASEPASAIDRVAETLRRLLEINALTCRWRDLSGDRLPPPGPGWRSAMRFLLETRTTKDTVYAVPAEFNAALAEKAVFTRQASAFLEYVDVPFRPLCPPVTSGANARSFPSIMLDRRTARRFADRPITEGQLSALLFYGWGMTTSVPNPLGDVFVRKTSPSGGSLHPVEVYPIVLNVQGVPRGSYHYSVRRHGLEQLSSADPRHWIIRACGDQEWVVESAVVFLCTAFLPRTAWKYDFSRVARAVMAETGFTGQSALLTATWLGLGGFTTAALRDEMFEELLGLDPVRQPALIVIGAGSLEPNLVSHARPRKETVEPVEGS